MTTPTFSTPPTAPSRQAPSTFSARMDAFLAYIVTLRGELVALVSWVGDQVTAVDADKTAAAGSASAAATSATEAADSATEAAGYVTTVEGLAASGIANYKGDHDGATAYVLGDSVTSGGFFWAAKRSNTGVTPVEGDDWTQISERPKSWVVKTTTYTAKTRDMIAADVSGGAWTLTLPASPATGDWVKVAITDGDPAVNNLTIDGGAADIDGAGTLVISEPAAAITIIFDGTEWQSDLVPLVIPRSGLLAVVRDEKAAGTAGGAGSADSWTQRDLNTIEFDPDSIVTLSSNTFSSSIACNVTFSAPAWRCGDHSIRLVRDSDDVVIGNGTSEENSPSDNIQTRSFGFARIEADTAYRIEHYIAGSPNTGALGQGNSNYPSVFTTVEFWS